MSLKHLKITQTDDCRVWLSSDWHGYHKNICAGETVWCKFPIPFKEWIISDKGACIKFCIEHGVRPFETAEEMTEVIVKNINEDVKENDILFFLGDWSFAGKCNICRLRSAINCKNIHIVVGNHDKEIANHANEMSSLFTSISRKMEVYIDDRFVVFDHYANRVWNRCHQRNNPSIHGHGHSHSKLPPLGRSLDIGIDMYYKLFGEYRAFIFDKFYEIVKDNEIIKHHENNGD